MFPFDPKGFLMFSEGSKGNIGKKRVNKCSIFLKTKTLENANEVVYFDQTRFPASLLNIELVSNNNTNRMLTGLRKKPI